METIAIHGLVKLPQVNSCKYKKTYDQKVDNAGPSKILGNLRDITKKKD